MSDRELRGMSGLVLLFVAVALLVGAGWRSAAPEGDGAPVERGPRAVERADGTPADEVRHFAVLPGWRAEQVATALEATGFGDGHRFLALVRDPSWAELQGPEWSGARTLEGYLAPGVYDVGPEFSEATLLRAMLERFEDDFTPAMARHAGELGLTVNEAVTLASIVEREKVFVSEAPVIAAVYLNRLRARMPLQADPTVLYALETAENHVGDPYWVRGLSRSSLRFDSPYNTYRHTGLPPGPIASPSRQTLLAVLYPASFDYRFFVARGDNTHYFSRGYAAHLRNIAAYRSGREPRESSGTELQRLVDRVVQPAGAHAGVVVENLTTGELATRNADEFFTAASLYKLAVLLKAFEQRERGRLRLAERIRISPEAAAQDVLELRRRLGRNPTVAAALREMIVVSNNAAGITFLNRFGRGAVERLLRTQGMNATSLQSLRLVTTPADVARLLELIARGRAVSPQASAAMLRLLGGQRVRDRLPRFLPEGARIAHKTGNIDYPSHDAGVLFTRRGPVVIVVMTEDAKNPARVTEMIAELGRIVFDYFEHYRPALARRDAVADWACPQSPFRGVGRGALAGRTVVLDPGHGGHDPGAEFRFADGYLLREKEVVLDVALRLKDLLVARGATVYLTRCRDVFVARMARAALANGIAPDIFLSVHVNGSPKRVKDGTEIYYFHNQGRRVANYLLGTFSRPALWEALSTKRALPNRGVHRRQFDVLTFALAPAALTESLFMTNPEEARLLRDRRRVATARRQQIAVGHLRGLLNYVGRGRDEEEEPVAPPPSYQAPRAAEVTVAAVGDIAMGSTPILPAGGGATLFSAVAPHLSADVSIGNLEGALTLGGDSKCGPSPGRACFAFRTPPWYGYWLRRAGFDVLNLANNHSADFGAEGTAGTIDALDNSALLHTGRPGQIARLQVGTVRVAVVGFAPYPWAQSLLDVPAARRLIEKADEWADVVVVGMHAGGEGVDWMHVTHAPEVYLGEPRGDPVAFAHAAVQAGADLVIGHGPHVLRGMEWYRGRLIAYSLGNFASHRTLSTRGPLGLGAILRARLRADGSWAGGKLVGTRLVTTGTPVEDRSGLAARLVRTLSSEDFGSSAATVTPDARIPGPVSVRRSLPVRPRREPPPLRRVAAELTPLAKARLLVVSGPPYPAGVGGVFVGRWNRRSILPRGALVFADQEGEPVKAFPNLPPWSSAAAYTDPAWAFAEGRNTGQALHYSGVHVDLAPVLDAPTGPLDERHFRRPALALAFARGLAAGGTGACVKHFPGLGSTPISTDVAVARGRVVAREVARFRKAIALGVKCVMVSHAVYPRLGRRPASLEPATYALLRASGFRGVSITDDLDALGREEAARSARLAAAAGADLLLFTSGKDASRAIEALVPLARAGRLDDRVERVLRLRRTYGLPATAPS